jgi:hypothetical protein
MQETHLEDDRQIEYLGVRVDGRFISEMDGRRALTSIPTSEIVGMKAVMGSDVRHPVLLFLLGVGSVGLGLYPFPRIFVWLMQGGMLHAGELWLVVWLFVGGYAALEAVKRKPNLLIETQGGIRKLVFRGSVQRQELQDFIHKMQSEFGHTVEFYL